MKIVKISDLSEEEKEEVFRQQDERKRERKEEKENREKAVLNNNQAKKKSNTLPRAKEEFTEQLKKATTSGPSLNTIQEKEVLPTANKLFLNSNQTSPLKSTASMGPTKNVGTPIEASEDVFSGENSKRIPAKIRYTLDRGKGAIRDFPKQIVQYLATAYANDYQKVSDSKILSSLTNGENKKKADEYVKDYTEYVKELNGNKNANQIHANTLPKDVQTAGTVADTVGNMIPSAVLSFIPVAGPIISSASMGLNVAGSSSAEVLENGGTAKQAYKTGTAKGATSVLLEKIAGGVKIGGAGALDDIASKGIYKLASKNAGKNVANFLLTKGYQVGGEIAEENLENIAGYAIDKLINNKDIPTLTEVWNDAKETSKTTFLSTIVMNMIGLGGSNFSYDNAISQIEQSTGKTLTSQEKQSVKNTLEEVQQQLLTMENGQVGIKEIVENQELAQQELAQNNNLSQNIPENMQNEYYNSAIKSNIDINNKTINDIYNVTNKRGIIASYNDDLFTNNNHDAIWRINKNDKGDITREVILNPNSTNTNKTLQNIIVHELTHDMEGQKIDYEQLRKFALSKMETQEGYDSAIENLKDVYSSVYDRNSTDFDTLVQQEAVADFLGENLGNQEFVNELVKSQNRNWVQKFYNWVSNKVQSFGNKIKGNTEAEYWRKVKYTFEKALNSEYQWNNTQSKFSIQTDKNGKQYVKVDIDQDIFEGIQEKDYNKIAKMYMKDYLSGTTNLSNNDTATIDSKSASKYTNPGKRQDFFNEKMKLTPELKNVLKIAKKESTSLPNKENSKYKSWEYYKFNFELDEKKFEGIVNIGIDKEGNKHFYEVNKIHFIGISSVSTNSQNKMDFINNSIAPLNDNVNTTKYSMQESENNAQKAKEYLDIKYSQSTKGAWNKFLKSNSINKGTGETMQDVKLVPQNKNVAPSKANNKLPVGKFTKEHTEAKPVEKYNKYKQNIIKSKEKEINNLISFKNETNRAIEQKIAEKEALLNSKKNKNTKVASVIKSQIEKLKSKKISIENLYNEKIDKTNTKINKEKIDFETRNKIKSEAREIIRAEISPLTEDLTKYKDKKMGILFKRETAQRNIDDIVTDKNLSEAIKETIFNPVQVHQANKTREINAIFKEINSLKLDKSKKYFYIPKGETTGIKIDEATLAQLFIEKKISDKDLINYGIGNAGIEKIHNISNTFTNILNTLYDRMNEEQIKYGYSPIGKIENYFPHFQENKADSMLGKIASYFGIDLSNQNLPTEIAGLTDTFKPGETWNSNLQKRKTNKTDYDALTAMERYVLGATEIIHTTEDIQKIREYAKDIRYRYSDKTIQEEIDKVINDSSLTQEARDYSLEGIFDNVKNGLPNFVTWLDDYANNLAGKKAFSDRNMERNIGRNMYNSMKGIEGRIASNIIGGNISVSLTNFAPLFQAFATTKPTYILTGMLQTTKNDILKMFHRNNIEFVNNSTFLTNRFGTDNIANKKISQKFSDKASFLMNAIDEFSAESIVKAKYLENIDKGIEEEKALDLADKYAGKIMADRSKGALPLIFNSKNPLSKLVTMFQVEPNNIVSNYFKDMPRDAESKMQLTKQYAKLMIASYIFSTIVMAIRGGNEVLPDPIRWVSYLIKMITGEDDEREKATTDLKESIIGSVPFLSNLAGFIGYEDIGRIPISNAMPDFSKIPSLFDKEADSQYKKETVIKEFLKPLIYLGLPTGGAQAKKTIEGISTVVKGGSYKTNKKGENQLQFAVENPNVLDYAKAGTFGKYSLNDSKIYSDRGYKALSGKQTKTYQESGIPFKEYTEYIDKKLEKKSDKINYINNTKWNTEQKWGLYRNEILSDTERDDGGSQLSDANYMIKNGTSKLDYIKTYNKAQENDINIPTQEEYEEMHSKGLSLDKYMDYKINVKDETEKQRKKGKLTEKQSLKDKEKIQILIDGNYSNKEKTALYENYILSSTDKNYPVIKESGININEYLRYKSQEFSADKKDDGTIDGISISGSKKKKVWNYINDMNITGIQKILLYGMEYTPNDEQQNLLFNYIKALPNKTKKEKMEILSHFKGYTIYEDGRVEY